MVSPSNEKTWGLAILYAPILFAMPRYRGSAQQFCGSAPWTFIACSILLVVVVLVVAVDAAAATVAAAFVGAAVCCRTVGWQKTCIMTNITRPHVPSECEKPWHFRVTASITSKDAQATPGLALRPAWKNKSLYPNILCRKYTNANQDSGSRSMLSPQTKQMNLLHLRAWVSAIMDRPNLSKRGNRNVCKRTIPANLWAENETGQVAAMMGQSVSLRSIPAAAKLFAAWGKELVIALRQTVCSSVLARCAPFKISGEIRDAIPATNENGHFHKSRMSPDVGQNDIQT